MTFIKMLFSNAKMDNIKNCLKSIVYELVEKLGITLALSRIQKRSYTFRVIPFRLFFEFSVFCANLVHKLKQKNREFSGGGVKYVVQPYTARCF
jgi:hypothetical protein